MTRLLLISPAFHGYHHSIGRAFERIGYEVSTYGYDVVDSIVEKAWNKARYELPAKVRGNGGHQSAVTVSRRAAQEILRVKPDVVLVIRGDTLTEEFWDMAAADRRRVAVWMYDEMRRTSFDLERVTPYARIASYSVHDTAALQAAGIDAMHVPNGYDAQGPIGRGDAGRGVVSFIGAPLPNRRVALEALHGAGVPVRAWGRGWSNHPFDRARTWRLSTSGVPNARDVPLADAQAIMRDSLATLNIHGDQDGFTMRTFEAAGSGAVQLIDRVDVDEFYVPGEEVLVFESEAELIDIARRVARNPDDFEEVRRRARERTLAEHTFVHRARTMEGLWA